MKVYELEREMVLGQKWAVEVHIPFLDEDGELCYETERHTFTVGNAVSFRKFYSMEIDCIRCNGDCITICVTDRYKDEVPFPDVE